MSVINDATILKLIQEDQLTITPLGPDAIQPASIDLRLGNRFITVAAPTPGTIVDALNPPLELPATVVNQPNGSFIINPGSLTLGSTAEYVGIPDHIVGRLEGKSSLGRIGLIIHATAGYIDPGFQGNITLEISNLSGNPIRLHPGMYIAQLALLHLNQPALKPYGHPDRQSRYQGQTGPTPARPPSNPTPAGTTPPYRIHISETEILDWYDGPLICSAQDQHGNTYIAAAVPPENHQARYLVKAATTQAIDELKNGNICLRTLLLTDLEQPWYLKYDDSPEIYPQTGSLLEREEFLPSYGYFLD